MKDLIIESSRMLAGLKRRGVDIVALAILLIVGIAAYGKWFYPVENLRGWERSVAVFELFFTGFLWMFRARAATWLAAALLFASWGGYASFWYQLKLPCSCMGTQFPIPTLYTIGLDALFIVASLLLAKRQGVSQRKLLVFGGLLLISAVAGFFVGQQVYVYFKTDL